MYQLCVLLLKFVRRYCVHHCGESWYNLWADLIGDAKCVKPRPEPRPTPVSPVIHDSRDLVAQSFKMASIAELLHDALAVDAPNLFDVDDVSSYLAEHLNHFEERLIQLNFAQPGFRKIAPLPELYDKYHDGGSPYRFKAVISQNDGNAYMSLRSLLIGDGDTITFEVLDYERYTVTLAVKAMPDADDIKENRLMVTP